MILHQQPPTPRECEQPEAHCKVCNFFQRCREIVSPKDIDIKKIASEIISKEAELFMASCSNGITD